jgi:hypothetical protein
MFSTFSPSTLHKSFIPFLPTATATSAKPFSLLRHTTLVQDVLHSRPALLELQSLGSDSSASAIKATRKAAYQFFFYILNHPSFFFSILKYTSISSKTSIALHYLSFSQGTRFHLLLKPQPFAFLLTYLSSSNLQNLLTSSKLTSEMEVQVHIPPGKSTLWFTRDDLANVFRCGG